MKHSQRDDIAKAIWRVANYSFHNEIEVFAFVYWFYPRNVYWGIRWELMGFDRSSKEPFVYCGDRKTNKCLPGKNRFYIPSLDEQKKESIEYINLLPHGIIDDCIFYNCSDLAVCKNCGNIDKVENELDLLIKFQHFNICSSKTYPEKLKAVITGDFSSFEEEYDILSKIQNPKPRKNLINYICSHCQFINEQKNKNTTKVNVYVDKFEYRGEIETDEYEPELKSLYLMKCNRNGMYKIGVSNNPKFREKTLSSEDPSIQLVGSWANLSCNERAWHEYFKQHRVRGEWFNLTKTQVELFCRLSTKNQSAQTTKKLETV